MFRTMKYHYKCNKVEHKILMFLFHISKNLYNSALYTLRQEYFSKTKMSSYFDLNKKLKNNENFHILNTYASICTIRQAHTAMSLFVKKKNKMPKYLSKKDVYALYTDQVRPITYSNKSCIKLPLSNLVRTNKVFKTKFKDYLINEFVKEMDLNQISNIYFPIPKEIQYSNIRQVRIIPKYKGKYIEVEFSYEKEIKDNLLIKANNTMAIDVGINNLLTIACSNNHSYIIDGKRLKSINQFYNKVKAKYQSKSKDNQYTRRMYHLDIRNKNRINDYLNKAVKQVISIVKKEQVNKLVIGYNKGLKQNGIKNERLTNKQRTKINQSFVRIPLTKLINKLKYKCEENNIEYQKVNESYTSKASFYDQDNITKELNYSGKRIKRGLYITKDNKQVNADINAALNILVKSKPNDDEEIHYLRDRGLTIPKRLQVIL